MQWSSLMYSLWIYGLCNGISYVNKCMDAESDFAIWYLHRWSYLRVWNEGKMLWFLRRRPRLLLFVALLQFAVPFENDQTNDLIIAKAGHVVPTIDQMDELSDEFIAFTHLGSNTYTWMEQGPDQWIKRRMLPEWLGLFTSMHQGGLCSCRVAMPFKESRCFRCYLK